MVSVIASASAAAVPTNSCVYKSDTCPICFDDIGKTNTATTSCGHVFCLQCISKHVAEGNSDCPLCKSTFAEGIEKKRDNSDIQHILDYQTHLLQQYTRLEQFLRYMMLDSIPSNSGDLTDFMHVSDIIDEMMECPIRYEGVHRVSRNGDGRRQGRRTIIHERRREQPQPQPPVQPPVQPPARQRPQRRNRCGICREHGHNRSTCPMRVR